MTEMTYWERGAEHIWQDGTDFWQWLREAHGYSREEVEEKTEGICLWEEQTMWEQRPGMPDVQQLEALATLYGTSPGELLDRCYTEMGRELREDEQ